MGRGRRKRTDDDDDNGFGAWGGYMAAKKSKLLEQFAESAGSETDKLSNIFKGVSISVNGYTKPSAEELKNLMSLHGGVFHHYHIPTRTTHIIASNLPDTKIKQLGWKNKIIKPEWITESIKANKLLDFSNFLLYTNHNRLQPRLNFVKITDQTSILNSEQTVEENSVNIPKQDNHIDVSSKNLDVINDFEEPLSPDMFGSYEDDVNCNDKDETTRKDEKSEINKDANETNLDKSNRLDINATSKLNDTKSKGRTLSAKDPKFLSEFYNNSRLHHISTLGAMFKQHICNLREQHNGKFPAREKLQEYIQKLNKSDNVKTYNDMIEQSYENPIIMHIDMDCFFVSVGLRSHPELRGQPVAVTHSKGGQEPSARSGVNRQAEIDCYRQRMQDRLGENANQLGPGNMLTRLETVENMSMSEIASCSYEARKAGVKNGMFMGAALKLCPNLKTIPYDFEGYKEVANTLYNTIAEYTLSIEAVSCDEMFVDISEILNNTGATIEQWAGYIRNLISERTKCPCSTGFGANRLQARMATKTAKPNGQFYLHPEDVENYMVNISVRDLPGIGHSINLKLKTLKVNTCGDLQLLSLLKLQADFGVKFGENLYNHCRGIDDKPLVYEHERKSVSAEVNYGIRFKDKVESENFLNQLCEEVHTRLTDIKMKGKCITLKLMVRSKDAPAESSKFMGHGVCDYLTKSSTLSIATNELDIIKREILSISTKLNVTPSELRGIGIQISRLEKLSKAPSSNILTKFLKSSDKNQTLEKCSKNNLVETKALDKTEDITKNSSNIPVNNKNASVLNFKTTENMKITERNSPVSNVMQGISKMETKSNITSRGRGKSSGVNQNISKAGKSRGRPKGLSSKNNRKENNTNNGTSLQNFFNPKNSEPVYSAPPSDIDLDVLSALPEDIQKEILKEYNLQKTDSGFVKTSNNQIIRNTTPKPESTPKKTTNDVIDQNNRPSSSSKNENVNIQDDMTQQSVGKSEQPMFLGMNLSEVRKLLREWVASESLPESCDITMLAEYFKSLAVNAKIDDLFIMLKFLYLEISKQNQCNWHRAYFEIVDTSQKGMIEKYGNFLYVYKKFNCDTCDMIK